MSAESRQHDPPPPSDRLAAGPLQPDRRPAPDNRALAEAFEQIADLLSLQDANPFRIRAYRNAARVLAGLKTDLAALVAAGKPLPKLPGVGEDLSGKLLELIGSGHVGLLDRLRRQVPSSMAELLQLPGLGPKRARALYEELHAQTLPQLLRAARDDRVRPLAGFGAKTQQQLIEALETRLTRVRRHKLADASATAGQLLSYMKSAPGVLDVQVAGSLRRARETVGDIDLLAVADHGRQVCDHFARFPQAASVISLGDTRASIVLTGGMQVDLRVVGSSSAGAALLYLTGSKAHNIALRSIAIAQGYKLNEYGLFQGERQVAGSTEASVYRALGLPWIDPELREDRGEIQAAREGRLPTLVEHSDLVGDLHVHSNWSDGLASIADMAMAAAGHGLHYVAICDHSRRLAVTHGLDAGKLERQRQAIAQLAPDGRRAEVLCGIEVDILPDGSLDLPADALEHLDIVVAAVHSSFRLPRARQTERILRALEGTRVDVLAHPLGRLIDQREPYDVDMEAVIRVCAERQIALELNAHPERLDLLDTWCRAAKDAGVAVAIDSDAHSPVDFDNLRFGVGQARRGWLEKGDVLNTRSLAQLRQWLARAPHPARPVAGQH
jgi:DNA polymerase (family 10)